MRILEINKFLYRGNGASTVMFNSGELLSGAGHEVAYFAMADPRNVTDLRPAGFAPTRSYDRDGGVGQRVRDAASAVYSVPARRSLRGFLRQWRPDVAHIHSIYHQLTLSVIDELVEARVPIVMSVHDYKIACPNISLYTHGHECHACEQRRLPWPAVQNRCIRGSVGGSAVGALELAIARARGSYHQVTRFIAPSQYVADVTAAAGIDPHRIVHIPHFVPRADFRDPRLREVDPEPTFFFMGRLEDSKGIETLLAAAPLLTNGRIVIAGEGNLEARVSACDDEHTKFLGFLTPAQMQQQIDRATALLVPSLWPEPFGMVVLEAGARGLPSIATKVGGLAELVDDHQDGVQLEPNDVAGLAAAIEELSVTPGLAAELGRNRYLRTERENSPEVHLPRLLEQFELAINAR